MAGGARADYGLPGPPLLPPGGAVPEDPVEPCVAWRLVLGVVGSRSPLPVLVPVDSMV